MIADGEKSLYFVNSLNDVLSHDISSRVFDPYILVLSVRVEGFARMRLSR